MYVGQLDGVPSLQIQVFLGVCGGLVPGQTPPPLLWIPKPACTRDPHVHGWHGAVCPAHLQIQPTASRNAGSTFPQHLLGLKALVTHTAAENLNQNQGSIELE